MAWDGEERRSECERHKIAVTELKKDVDEIKQETREIKIILIGNGRLGVAEMARRSFEFMSSINTSKNGLMDWTFRIVISIILGFVAIKVGLK